MKQKHIVTSILILSILYGCSSPTPLPTEAATEAIPTATTAVTEVLPTPTEFLMDAVLPPATGDDAKPTCTVTTDGAADFATWFAGGKVEANGIVTPADSLNFNEQSNCSFFQWSERMFLWLTSSVDNKLVFTAPTNFYIVSPRDLTTGHRSFILNTDAAPMLAVLDSKNVDVDEGQAGINAALMSQEGSLVYYMITTNDVFAYFVTGTTNNKNTKSPATPFPFPTQFPSNSDELKQITDYASANGASLSDANTMAMEIKTSWVDASTLADSSSYIKMDATIPVFGTATPDVWNTTGSKPVTLALVGMHVVGSTAGHPEMIWATFEHKNNSPKATYAYTNKAGETTTVQSNTTGNWLFSANNPPNDTIFNTAHMTSINGNIKAISPNTISPSNSIRSKAWGSASNQTTSIALNTDIISMNNDILSKLASGDLRSNYILIGATWTSDGLAPTIDPGSTSGTGGNQVGTNMLSNSTLETYTQDSGGDVTSSLSTTNNCFSCHKNNNFSAGVPVPSTISHIFKDLLPLFTPMPISPSIPTSTPTPKP